MKNLKILVLCIFIIFSAFIYAGCCDHDTCNVDLSLNDAERSMNPYTGNETLRFLDPFGKTLEVYAAGRDSYTSFEVIGGCCDGDKHGVIETDTMSFADENGWVYIMFTIERKRSDLPASLRITINDRIYSIRRLEEPELKQLEINGITYNDVYFSGSLNSNFLYYTRNEGIIKFADRNGNVYSLLP